MTIPHVVIIGGGFGGLAAARVLEKRRRRRHARRPHEPSPVPAAALPGRHRGARAERHHGPDPLAAAREPAEHHSCCWPRRARSTPSGASCSSTTSGASSPTTISSSPPARATRTSATTSGSDVRAGAQEHRRRVRDAARFLIAFEEAEKTEEPRASRVAYLTFVIVGAGPTGVELAGSIPDTRARASASDFRRIDPSQTRVVLIEGGPAAALRVPRDALRARAAGPRAPRRRGATRLGRHASSSPTRCTSARSASRRAPCSGPPATPRRRSAAARRADRPRGARAGRRGPVGAGAPRGVRVGDLAAYVDRGNPVPGVAPAANQMGEHAAKQILATLAGAPRTPFRYIEQGRPRDDRPPPRGRALRHARGEGIHRVVALAVRAPHVSRRLPQPREGARTVGVRVLHLPARRASHRRHRCASCP